MEDVKVSKVRAHQALSHLAGEKAVAARPNAKADAAAKAAVSVKQRSAACVLEADRPA